MAVTSHPPKIFGAVLLGLFGQECTEDVGVVLDCTSQLVAHELSSNGETPVGSPVFQRIMLESCQPPSKASAPFPTFPKKACPLPIGTCQTKSALIECLTSKSELA